MMMLTVLMMLVLSAAPEVYEDAGVADTVQLPTIRGDSNPWREQHHRVSSDGIDKRAARLPVAERSIAAEGSGTRRSSRSSSSSSSSSSVNWHVAAFQRGKCGDETLLTTRSS